MSTATAVKPKTPQKKAPAKKGASVVQHITPVLEIDQEAWQMIAAYVDNIDVEINGFALVTQINPHTFHVEAGDVFITEQEVTGGSADIDPEAFIAAGEYARAQGRSSDLKLQWHSHVNMSAYFSTTDVRTINEYGETGVNWIISLVTNKRGEFQARIDIFFPVRMSMDMEVRVLRTQPEHLVDQAIDDIERMVTQMSPRYKGGGYGYGFGWAGMPGISVEFDPDGFDDEDEKAWWQQRGFTHELDDDEWEALVKGESNDDFDYDLLDKLLGEASVEMNLTAAAFRSALLSYYNNAAMDDQGLTSTEVSDMVDDIAEKMGEDPAVLDKIMDGRYHRSAVADDVGGADSEHFDDQGRRTGQLVAVE